VSTLAIAKAQTVTDCSKRGLGDLRRLWGMRLRAPRLASIELHVLHEHLKDIWHDYFEVMIQTADQSL